MTGFDAQAVADRVARELTSGVVVIDGPSGAGKTHFADALVTALHTLRVGTVLVRTDEFATWDDPAGWWDELERDVLQSFRRRHDYRYHPRLWRDGEAERGPAVWVRWEPLLVIEGVTSARSRVTERADRAFWIDGGDAHERLERAVSRDGEACRHHLKRWQEFETGWFAVDRTRERCEVLDLPGA